MNATERLLAPGSRDETLRHCPCDADAGIEQVFVEIGAIVVRQRLFRIERLLRDRDRAVPEQRREGVAVLAVERDRDLVRLALSPRTCRRTRHRSASACGRFWFALPFSMSSVVSRAPAGRAAAIVIDRDQGVVPGRYRLAEADQLALDAKQLRVALEHAFDVARSSGRDGSRRSRWRSRPCRPRHAAAMHRIASQAATGRNARPARTSSTLKPD